MILTVDKCLEEPLVSKVWEQTEKGDGAIVLCWIIFLALKQTGNEFWDLYKSSF